MAAAAILDFQFMWIWPFRRVDSVVFVICIKFGSNICYSHWDRRTYASDLRLMTSCELISGFDFWSRGHLCMAVMHLPIKFGAYIFIQSGVIDWYFSKSKDGGRRHLGFVWMSHGTTHEASFVVRTSCKNFVMIRYLVFKLWGFEFFLVQAWKSYSRRSRPPNFGFWGILSSKFSGTSFRPSKGTSFSGTTRFKPSLVQIGRTVRPVALAKKPKKKKRQWQTGYLSRPPTSPYRRQSLHAGWPPVYSSIFQVS